MISVWRTASRIRSISVADLRPRTRVTIGSAETNFPAWGVPASVSSRRRKRPCVIPSAESLSVE
jgi:hypothetical protein